MLDYSVHVRASRIFPRGWGEGGCEGKYGRSRSGPWRQDTRNM